MKRITKQKIYNGKVELRDYEVAKLLKWNEPVRIVVGRDYMILTPKQLKEGTKTNTFNSIHNPQQAYTLIGFEWKPAKDALPLFSQTPTTQKEYVDVKFKLSQLWKDVLSKKGVAA